jgi:hypothetical protein
MLYVLLVKNRPMLVWPDELPQFARWPVLAQSEDTAEVMRRLDEEMSRRRSEAANPRAEAP